MKAENLISGEWVRWWWCGRRRVLGTLVYPDNKLCKMFLAILWFMFELANIFGLMKQTTSLQCP